MNEERFRAAVKAADLRISQVARRAKVDRSYLYRAMWGERTLSKDILAKVAAVLNVKPSFLTGL